MTKIPNPVIFPLIIFYLMVVSVTQSEATVTNDVGRSTVTQKITLQPGWNSVYLEVTPSVAQPEAVFNLEEIESVWFFAETQTHVEYLTSPDEIGFNKPGWYLFKPGDDKGLNTLSEVVGGKVYLIKLDAGSERTFEISGVPAYQSVHWNSQSFSLLGFPIDTSSETLPTFEQYLNWDTCIPGPNSPCHPRVYRLVDNEWRATAQTATMESGKGYWIYNDGSFQQSSPIQLSPGLGQGMHFGANQHLRYLTLNNPGNEARTVRFETGLQLKVFSGREKNEATGILESQWRAITDYSLYLGAGVERRLLLAIERPDDNSMQQGMLTIKAAGLRRFIPVTAESLLSDDGLWVGAVSIDKVSYVHGEQTGAALPVDVPMQLKLILHKGPAGVQLLKQVYFVSQKPGRLEPERPPQPIDSERKNLALVTDDQLLSDFLGIRQSNGYSIGQRISASGFEFSGQKVTVGDDFNSLLSVELDLTPEMPTHPMKHQYHPRHDSINANGDPINNDMSSPLVQEVWNIKRKIELVISQSLEPSVDRGLGVINGEYREEIIGLHKRSIFVEGQFSLERISLIDKLNPLPLEL